MPTEVYREEGGDGLSFDPETTELRYQIRRGRQQYQESLASRVRNLRRTSNALLVGGIATFPLDYLGDMSRDNALLRVATVASWAGAVLTRMAAHDRAAGLE